MNSDIYKTISGPTQGLYKEKGSKFMAFAFPVESVEEVREHLERLRKEYYDARHHCYAYILGADKATYRANDDGEPSGTGGRPIYGQLLSYEVSDVLIVVVRYFGGVLLGASGLANAYKAAARDALQQATIVERTVDDIVTLRFDYAAMNDVMRILKDYDLRPVSQQFEMDCRMTLRVRQSLSGQVSAALMKTRVVEVRIN